MQGTFLRAAADKVQLVEHCTSRVVLTLVEYVVQFVSGYPM